MLLLLALLAVQAAPDPLAPAREGKVQCYAPDTAKKTCASMARYTTADGRWLNHASIGLGGDLVVETVAPSTVEDDAVCTVITSDYAANAVFTLAGKPMADNDARPIRAALSESLQPAMGRKTCVRYHEEGAVVTSSTTLDGVAKPDMDMAFIWVDPGDGYTLVRP